MKIEIAYTTGAMDVFDTATLTSGQALGGASIVAHFHLDLRHADDEGVWVDIHSHERTTLKDATPDSRHVRGCRVWLVDPADVGLVEEITLDGMPAAWRQGGRLVDGLLFQRMIRRCYSGAPYASDNSKAVYLYEYVACAKPALREDPAQACESFGWPLEAFLDAKRSEDAQPSDDVE